MDTRAKSYPVQNAPYNAIHEWYALAKKKKKNWNTKSQTMKKISI